jgi:hypothetical protein
LAFAGLGAVICTFSTTAYSQGPANTRCPAGYWLMDALCLNDTTGDVVKAAPAAASPVAFEPGCPPGYWRHDRLCLNAATGDVEIVDETMWPRDRRPEARN